MLRQPLKHLVHMLCLLALVRPAVADDAAYLAALDKELDNRAVALDVVPALAERHAGTAQGRFWSAYAVLEAAQLPRYQAQARRHDLQRTRSGGFKAQASLAFSWLQEKAFVKMLANATADYLAELQAVPRPDDAETQAFWAYVIEQERVQVEALAQAREGDYDTAAATLQRFVAEQLNAPLQ